MSADVVQQLMWCYTESNQHSISHCEEIIAIDLKSPDYTWRQCNALIDLLYESTKSCLYYCGEWARSVAPWKQTRVSTTPPYWQWVSSVWNAHNARLADRTPSPIEIDEKGEIPGQSDSYTGITGSAGVYRYWQRHSSPNYQSMYHQYECEAIIFWYGMHCVASGMGWTLHGFFQFESLICFSP